MILCVLHYCLQSMTIFKVHRAVFFPKISFLYFLRYSPLKRKRDHWHERRCCIRLPLGGWLAITKWPLSPSLLSFYFPMSSLPSTFLIERVNISKNLYIGQKHIGRPLWRPSQSLCSGQGSPALLGWYLLSPFSSIVYFPHRRRAQIKSWSECPKSKRLIPFKTLSAILGPPGFHFGFCGNANGEQVPQRRG